jgi:hypothetical protein
MQQTANRQHPSPPPEESTGGAGHARRRLPRRQLVLPVAIERRRGNRREGVLGSDGLRRIVLADDWRAPS